MSSRPGRTAAPLGRRRLPHAAALQWGALAALLLALLIAAATFDRSRWPGVVGDEATYLMQAESLAWDLDLEYTRADFDRFVAHWRTTPEGLILQKGEGSESLAYGKPFFYALWAAPFSRLSPTRGPFIANALLLALAAIVAARALERSVGAAAPAWVALFVFASIAFAHVFWAHIDLFLMCLAALALALAYGAEEWPRGEPVPARAYLRWLAAGICLAVVGYSRPLYLPLVLPALLAARRRGRWPAVSALVAGAVLLCLATVVIQQGLAGSWTSYGAERRSFYTNTGFPDVDFAAAEWAEFIDRFGNAAWLKEHDLAGIAIGAPRLWGWNLLYLVAGQSVGLLPYLLPGFLGLLTWRRRRPHAERWTLLVAVGLTALGFFVLRPHNFYGGGAALANRYILPVYPALWFLATGPLRGAWLALTAALSAPFLWPLWSAPRAYPLDAQGVTRYVSRAAWTLLPYETTQNHLKPGGAQPDVNHNGLWVKPLSPGLRVADGGRLVLSPELGPGELLLGAERPLDALHLETAPGAPAVRVRGAEASGEIEVGDGARRYWLELARPRARHPMWWTRDDFYLYWLRIEPVEGGSEELPFSLSPATGAGPPA